MLPGSRICILDLESELWRAVLILIFSDHVHGFDDLLLVVEAKFKSGKSGTEEMIN
jgi:hypothetical protein